MFLEILPTLQKFFSKEFISHSLSESATFISKSLGFVTPLNKETFFGFFFLGLLAAFWVWSVFALMRFWDFLTGGDLKKQEGRIISFNFLHRLIKNENEAFNYDATWLYLVAGKLWKVFVFAVGFTILMYIPIINKIVQLIIFGFWDIGILARSIIIAIEYGFLPSLFEYFTRVRLEQKQRRALMRVRKLRAGVSEKD